jgi:phosphocarrier protein
MYEKDVIIQNGLGLFARPAMFFIQKANEFKSTIFIEIDDKKVNAKSLLGVLSLGVMQGQTITISADGVDDKEAVESLTDLINSRFEGYENLEEES